MMVLAGGAFGRWLAYESRTFMNGIHALIKQATQRSLAPSLR